jgi:hypothetical protein
MGKTSNGERNACVGTRPGVEAIGDGIEVVLTVDREIRAFGQVLA